MGLQLQILAFERKADIENSSSASALVANRQDYLWINMCGAGISTFDVVNMMSSFKSAFFFHTVLHLLLKLTDAPHHVCRPSPDVNISKPHNI